MRCVDASARRFVLAAAKRRSQGTRAGLGWRRNGLSGVSIQRRPWRSAAGVASGVEWLGQMRPALPAEQPAASAEPRSTRTGLAPRRASSSATAAPIAPPPTIRTSSVSPGTGSMVLTPDETPTDRKSGDGDGGTQLPQAGIPRPLRYTEELCR